MRPDDQIARLAAKQHNAFTTAQVKGCGLSQQMIDYRVKTGRWTVLHRGVYAIAGAPGTARQLVMAAVLVTDGVASHISAGYLHGLYKEPSLPIHVISAKRGRRGIRPHDLPLDANDVRTVDGIPVTNIERTLFDLATIEKFTRYAMAHKRPRKIRKALEVREEQRDFASRRLG